MADTTNWQTLPAGRELDEEVAQRVMDLPLPPRGYLRMRPVPHYSTDITAAWGVMDALIARGLRPSLCLMDDGRWVCDGHWDDLHGDQSADTPALAICRAALAFVQYNPAALAATEAA